MSIILDQTKMIQDEMIDNTNDHIYVMVDMVKDISICNDLYVNSRTFNEYK